MARRGNGGRLLNQRLSSPVRKSVGWRETHSANSNNSTAVRILSITFTPKGQRFIPRAQPILHPVPLGKANVQDRLPDVDINRAGKAVVAVVYTKDTSRLHSRLILYSSRLLDIC